MKKRALALLLALSASGFAGNYSSWSKYRTVTVNTSGMSLSSAVANIPVLVRFNSTDHADMLTGIQPNGTDIRVTLADGSTDVPFEIEAATGTTIALWIKAPSVSQNSATAATFRVYWGKTGQTTMSNPSAVFDTTNGYLAVWHLNGDANDATGYGHNGTVGTYGTGTAPVDTMGIAGNAKRFTGAQNNSGTNGGFYSVVQGTGPTTLNLNTNNGQYTLSAWVRPDTCTNNVRMALVSKYANDASNKTKAWALQTSGGSGNWRHVNNPINLYNQTLATGHVNEFFSESPCTVKDWQYVSSSYKSNGVTAVDTLNADMAARITATTNGAGTTAPGTAPQGITTIGDSADVLIGRLHGGSGAGGNLRFLRGALDEVRISRVARDSNWTEIEYATQRPTGGTAVTVGSTQTQTPPVVNGPYAPWTGHRKIVLNTTAAGANVASHVTNFPVLVRLGPSETSIIAAANNGNSIRFSKSDTVTALPYEIEHWSSTGAAIWVKVDTVYGNNSSQSIFMHYGNDTALARSNSALVFDTANGFVAAWHLGNTTGSNPRPNVVTGAPSAVVRNMAGGYQPVRGLIGMADSLSGYGGTPDTAGLLGVVRGTKPYIDMRGVYAGYNNLSSGAAYSVWINPNTEPGVNGYARFLQMTSGDSSGNPPPNSRLAFLRHATNNGSLAVRHGGLGGNTSFQPMPLGNWIHLSFSKTAAGPTKVYVNGDSIHVYGDNSALKDTVRAHAFIGRSWDPANEYLAARVDEPVLSKGGRSSAWIKLSYQNQKAANSLVDIGMPGLPSAPGTPTGVAGNAQVAVTWTAPSSDGGTALTSYKAYAVSDTAKFCATSGATSCTITGLTNGTGYTFQVRAFNGAGGGTLSGASSSISPIAPVGGVYANWAGHRTITLNTSSTGAGVNGTVTNFPVLVRLLATDTAVTAANNVNGASMRFSKMNDTTALPYQIESWSTTAGAAIWVRVDSVKGNNATQGIRMHYGNSAATSQSSGVAVFDTTTFAAVWHLNDTSDATGRAAHTAIASTTPPTALAASLIGGGKTFNGTSNWYTVGTDSTTLNMNTNNGPYSLSAWVNATSCGARIAVITKYVNNQSRQYALHTGNTSTDWRFTNSAPAMRTAATPAEFAADAAGTCVEGSWTHVVGTYRSGTPTADSSVNAKIYVNGVFAANAVNASIPDTTINGRAPVFIGRLGNAERYMNGSLDEIVVAKVAFDSNWIKLAYQNQKARNSLINIGNPPVVAPGAPTLVSATNSTTTSGSVILTWSAPSNDGGATITGYTVTGTPAGSCTVNALTCTISGLTTSTPTPHTFTVKATNTAGQSVASNALTVTPVVGIAGGSYLVHADGFTKSFTFRLPEGFQTSTETLKMTISDIHGRTVWVKTISPKETQAREISWNGKTSQGAPVAAGMYIVKVKMEANGKTQDFIRKDATLTPGR